MHIIFTPLPIPLLHRFAGKYGRSPRARTPFFVPLPRSFARPPARPSSLEVGGGGGRWRCQSAAACLQRLLWLLWLQRLLWLLEQEGVAAVLCVGLFMAVGLGVRYMEPVV